MPTTNLLIDPTDPNQAQVQGITPPATPQVGTTGIAPAVPAPAGIAPVTQELPAVQDTGVASRVAALTSEDSPLMKQARTAGLQQANARGVLNSSIAAGASENEAIRAAAPIAEQEAAAAQQSNTQRYDLSAAMDRLRAQAGYEQQARAEGYQYSSALNQQGYTFQAQQLQNQQSFEKDMAQVQQGYAIDTANLQSTLQAKLQSQANDQQIQRMGVDFANQFSLQASAASHALDQISAQGDVQLKLQTNQFQEAMKELTLSLNEQNSVAMANASVNLFQAEAGLRAALLSNENIPAAERAAYEQQISALTGPTRDYISKVLGYVPATATTTAPAAAGGVQTNPVSSVTGIAPTGGADGGTLTDSGRLQLRDEIGRTQ